MLKLELNQKYKKLKNQFIFYLNYINKSLKILSVTLKIYIIL